ncbi:hypothetical protein, partial [Brucella endophytica]|uniref:hypothetical protein n=1 Tax=Brucella endophytica TaxID=1963359 RepID=UPI00166F09BE
PNPPVGAADIVNGLSVRVSTSSTLENWTYQAGDVVTVYYYLSGNDPVSGNKLYNVCTVTYTVSQGDDLARGFATTLPPLPQELVAGYGNGTIQLNFSVYRASNNTTYWSRATIPQVLNTVV